MTIVSSRFDYGQQFAKLAGRYLKYKIKPMDKHNLIDEFPEYREKIHDLKVSDAHFHKIFDTYDKVNTEIHRIESGAEATSDEVLNELRFRRVHLKDDVLAILQQN